MLRLSPERLCGDWRRMLSDFQPFVIFAVRTLADRRRRDLASHFYQQMLNDPAAARLVSHELVKMRLNSSLMRWVGDVFSVGPDDDIEEGRPGFVKFSPKQL